MKRLLILLPVLLLFSACANSSRLPADVEQVLLAYWESIPTVPGVENEIVGARRGEPTENPEMESWCVEAIIHAPDEPSIDGEILLWIIFRQSENADWAAALLMTMSSTWPYEACGES